jgi:hypothetical protein
MQTVILTTYFSKGKHPQSTDSSVYGLQEDGRVSQSDINYIKVWYDSVNDLKLKGVVFHDNLSDAFTNRYTTENISFVKVGTPNFSYNDYRFFCYINYLEGNPCEAVFMTDASDVKVVKDPKALIDKYPDYSFFTCRDNMKVKEYTYSAVSMGKIIKVAGWPGLDYMETSAADLQVINMGVIGGTYKSTLDFLKLFTEYRLELGNTGQNINMVLGNYIFRYLYQDKKILVGEPVTSVYKSLQNDRKDVFFIHK